MKRAMHIYAHVYFARQCLLLGDLEWRPSQVTALCRQGKRNQIETGGTPGAYACSIPETWSSQLNWDLVVYEAGGLPEWGSLALKVLNLLFLWICGLFNVGFACHWLPRWSYGPPVSPACRVAKEGGSGGGPNHPHAWAHCQERHSGGRGNLLLGYKCLRT